MENLSHIRDENGLETPLTAANLSLKITSTQLDQEFYDQHKQTNKHTHTPVKLLKTKPVTWSVGLRTQRKRRKRPSMGKMSQTVKRQEMVYQSTTFKGDSRVERKAKEKAFISGHAVYSEYNIPSVSRGARKMNTQ